MGSMRVLERCAEKENRLCAPLNNRSEMLTRCSVPLLG
jgi:hypothetical protein